MTLDRRRSTAGCGIGRAWYWNPLPSAASISPGRSGEISFSSTSAASRASRPSRRNSGLKPISNGSPWNGTGTVSRASPTSGVRADTVSSPSAKLSRSGAFFCASSEMRRTTSVISAPPSRSSCSYASGSSWRTFGNWPSISREESTTPAASKTTWLDRSDTAIVSALPCWTMRVSSCSARAGTLASNERASGASSRVSLTARR